MDGVKLSVLCRFFRLISIIAFVVFVYTHFYRDVETVAGNGKGTGRVCVENIGSGLCPTVDVYWLKMLKG